MNADRNKVIVKHNIITHIINLYLFQAYITSSTAIMQGLKLGLAKSSFVVSEMCSSYQVELKKQMTHAVKYKIRTTFAYI